MTSNIRRLSTRSANVPDGYANNKKGNVIAVCTSAMVRCDVGIVAISHVTPTSFIHVPILEMVMAIHIALKTGYRNGLRMDCWLNKLRINVSCHRVMSPLFLLYFSCLGCTPFNFAIGQIV